MVAGFSSFQFADDKTRTLTGSTGDTRDRCSGDPDSRAGVRHLRVPCAWDGRMSGIATVFKPLLLLFPPEAWRA